MKGFETFKRDFVRRHNELRAVHGCSPLKYDDSIARSAQKWANHLKDLGTLAHGDMENCGQSLSVSVTDISGDRVTQLWYDENEHYDYNKPGWNQHCTNFTQMVWKATTSVGVGCARRPGGMLYIVAHYYPAGNVGSFRLNVPVPTGTRDRSAYADELRENTRQVMPIPDSGQVPPPPPPPPDTPLPPPVDEYTSGGSFIRKAILGVYSPFDLTGNRGRLSSPTPLVPPELSKDAVKSQRTDSSSKEETTTKTIVANVSSRSRPRMASTLVVQDAPVRHMLNAPRKMSKTEDYWDAARHVVRFKRSSSTSRGERLRNPSGAFTSNGKIRATKTFNKDPAMEDVNRTMRREFVDEIDKSQSELMQQLRGVFSAADEDGDGFLNISQLREALLSFGVRPSEHLIEHFVMLSRSDGRVDMATFMYVFSKIRENDDVTNCASDVKDLFEFLKHPFARKTNTKELRADSYNDLSRVSPALLKHVLSEVDVPNRLTREEAQDFLIFADNIMKTRGSSIQDANFEDLLRIVMQ